MTTQELWQELQREKRKNAKMRIELEKVRKRVKRILAGPKIVRKPRKAQKANPADPWASAISKMWAEVMVRDFKTWRRTRLFYSPRKPLPLPD